MGCACGWRASAGAWPFSALIISLRSLAPPYATMPTLALAPSFVAPSTSSCSASEGTRSLASSGDACVKRSASKRCAMAPPMSCFSASVLSDARSAFTIAAFRSGCAARRAASGSVPPSSASSGPYISFSSICRSAGVACA
eukprot:Mycagemm_TRINITY_DN10321_c5_g16::TRINITY_DN10321_c5_g16_i1::g.787::m.787 type:complete len:141 gc:universal TRINITY_DN10321_c5_g16_i1:512-90(-)